MNDEMKRAMNTIPLPPELRERSKMGVAQAKSERILNKKRFGVRRWTAVIAGLILISSVLFHSQVIAALQKALQFIPGLGVVMEEDIPAERYILQKPVNLDLGEKGSLIVTGISVDKESTLVTMAATNLRWLERITIINEEGQTFDIPRSVSSSSGSGWNGSYWYKGELDIRGNITIVLDTEPETKVPITLNKAETHSNYQELGATVSANNVDITAITNRAGAKAIVSLVSRHPSDFRIDDYGIRKNIIVTDSSGQRSMIEEIPSIFAPAKEFYFSLSDNPNETYTLTIPEITVTYVDEEAITFHIPKTGIEHDNRTIELAGFPLTFTKVERISDDQLRVYVDLHDDESAAKSLTFFYFGSMSSMMKSNEQTGVMEYIQIDIDPDATQINVEVTRPRVTIRGPWEFEFTDL